MEGLAYHRGWDMLYWTSYTTSTITRHTVDQSRWGAVDRHTVVTMSGDDHPRAFVLDECQGLELIHNFKFVPRCIEKFLYMHVTDLYFLLQPHVLDQLE